MIDAILHHSEQAKQQVDASLYPRGTCSIYRRRRRHRRRQCDVFAIVIVESAFLVAVINIVIVVVVFIMFIVRVVDLMSSPKSESKMLFVTQVNGL